MEIKRAATGIAIAGVIALGAAVVIDKAPLRAESIAGDAEKATHNYRVSVTGMT